MFLNSESENIVNGAVKRRSSPPSPSRYPWRHWLSAAIGAAVLSTAITSAASDTSPKHSVDVSHPSVVFPTAKVGQPHWPAQATAPAGAPNILLIMTDDEGFGASSAFGGAIPTPAFDTLARGGLRYNNFNTTGMCSPSRASLLTGRYPHNVQMGGLADAAAGIDGYTSVIPKSATTVAEVLRRAGYSTAMFGKAHITPPWELSASGPFDRWPTGLGFEYFYGFLQGDTNQWAPSLVENTRYVLPPSNDPTYVLDRDLADRTIAWIHQQHAATPTKPFFIYYATGSTHAPHHAPPEWIAKFRGKFDQGWDALRQEIFARQKAAGIIPTATDLPPRPSVLPAWSALSPDERKLATRFMEAYAGQLAFLDAQLGRVFAAIDEAGLADNTLVIVIQGDNGASGEGGLGGNLFEQTMNFSLAEDPAYDLAHLDEIGGPLTSNMYPAGWAWALNTPFKWFKQNASHFGGVRNGLIIRWRGHVAGTGVVRTQFAHIADIVPTIYEAAGVVPPDVIDGVAQQPLDGVSLAYTFQDAEAPARRTTQYFEIMENAAIYHGGWIAATSPAYMPWELFSPNRKRIPFNERDWELYDVRRDFSQAHNLAQERPDKLRELQGLFLQEGVRNHVFPVHGILDARAGRPEYPARIHYSYTRDVRQLHADAAPPLGGRSFEISTEVSVSDRNPDGVLVAQGGRFSGYSLYIKDGRLNFAYNAVPPRIYLVRARDAVSPGAHSITASFACDCVGAGPGGIVTLAIDGREVARGRIPHTLPRMWFTEGLDVGRDLLTPVSPDYATPFEFGGDIRGVSFDLK